MKRGNDTQFDRLVRFLKRLRDARIPHRLDDNREDAVSILAFAPGEYWEIDFLADGEIDVERFRSSGNIDDESSLEKLFTVWADTNEPANEDSDAAGARK